MDAGRKHIVGSIPILFEDNHLLVVSKPAGMLSQADRTGDPDVLSAAKAYVKDVYDKPGDVYLGLVHRLDRPVSGVMVLARTSKAAARLTAQFKDRLVQKCYVAVVGGPCAPRGVLSNYLSKRNGRVIVVGSGDMGAKWAELTYRKVGEVDRGVVLIVQPKTGRKHQIRIQLAEIGNPIVGDMRYGSTSSWDGRNLALHCLRIGLEHPTKHVRVSFSMDVPPTWPADVREHVDAADCEF